MKLNKHTRKQDNLYHLSTDDYSMSAVTLTILIFKKVLLQNMIKGNRFGSKYLNVPTNK
jgi:hypothetical protein